MEGTCGGNEEKQEKGKRRTNRRECGMDVWRKGGKKRGREEIEDCPAIGENGWNSRIKDRRKRKGKGTAH